MSSSALIAAVEAKNYEMLRAAMVGELVPVIAPDVDPQSWDPRELGPSGGNVFQAVIWQERLWFRDEESTDDHDEITVITLADGVNYLTNDIRFPQAVESRLLTEPPDGTSEPQIGEAWLVAEGAAGDWAGHDNERAMLTARGWKFRPGEVGDLLYIKDPTDLGFVHFNADDEWEDGVGPRNLIDGSVLPRHLLIRQWAVEDQTTTAPPVSGPAGEQYIIGAGATGPWAGHDGKLAWRPAVDANFVVSAPFIGEEAYNKALGYKVRWNGVTWESAAGTFVRRSLVSTKGSANTNAAAAGSDYSYSTGTAPTLSNNGRIDNVGLSHTALRAGARLRISYNADLTADNPATYVAGLFRGAETNAIAWKPAHVAAGLLLHVIFNVTAPDAASHEYKVKLFRNNSSNTINTITDRDLEVLEEG